MAWHSHGHDQASLVDALVRNGLVSTPAVEEALRRVDRAPFCDARAAPYQDAPQRTPYAGATISAPHMHAQCLELVARFVRRAAEARAAAGAGAEAEAEAAAAGAAPPPPPSPLPVRVLDVGCGTGYLLAALSHFAAASGARAVEVVGVERLEPLAQAARELLCGGGGTGALSLLPRTVAARVTVVVGDGHAGWPAGAPYDVIHVGAAVSGGVPRALLEQLAPGGVLVAPLVEEDDDEEGEGEGRQRQRQQLWLLEKGEARLGPAGAGQIVRRTRVMPVVYVPLVKEAAATAVVGSAGN